MRLFRKILSYTIDVILVGFILTLIYVQVSMMVSKNSNFGVPRAFGKSFLYVASESMDDPDNPNGIHKGSGIVIDQCSVSDLAPSTPKSFDEEGNPTDWNKDGDIVTFYYVTSSYSIVDTHRLVDISDNGDGTYTLKTMGDNPEAHAKHVTETWDSKYLIGKEVYHSDALGSFLAISSADAANKAGGVAWFFPVAILVPTLILTAMYIYDPIKTYVKENKARKKKIDEALEKSGIDLNDEKAVELFRMKEDMRLDYIEEYEENKAKYKKQLEQAKERALKEARKEAKKK
ncbi:MAG: hypothetical protein J5880_01535 [Bacilli bacterium]|nr:hypothetical protein [Bacilli bacterium]MBO4682242.1 hypothetical protein [Bacilli bacterium]